MSSWFSPKVEKWGSGIHGRRLPSWCFLLLFGCWGDAPGTTASTGATNADLQPFPPEHAEDVFSQERWTAHVERISEELGFDLLEPIEPGTPARPAYIPLDSDLLGRVTFLGVPAAELDRLMRVHSRSFIEGQPYGSAGYVMWPQVEKYCDLILILRWEIDDDLVPVVTSEDLEERCRPPGFRAIPKKPVHRAAPIDAFP